MNTIDMLMLEKMEVLKARNVKLEAAHRLIKDEGYEIVPVGTKARIAELEAALQPFAREADTHGDQIPDQMFIWDYEGERGGRNELRVGDLRNARAVLQAKGET